MSPATIWIVSVLLWWAIGAAGFIFWWTKDYDLNLSDLGKVAFTGLIGPATWYVGYTIHGDKSKSKPKVLVRKRGS